jgi:peptidoglycan/xylan/chitin deacetylase (PgdA/CDA1 family)
MDAKVIRELLSPWEIVFVAPEEADCVITYKCKPSTAKPAVIIPSCVLTSPYWAQVMGLNVSVGPGSFTTVAATPQTSLAIKPHTQYFFKEQHDFPQSSESLNVYQKDEDSFLSIDLIEEYNLVVKEIMEPNESKLYKLATSLPTPYGLVPKRVRDHMLKMNHSSKEELNLCDKLPIDALRFILKKAIEEASGSKIEKSVLLQRNLCLLTHDVETANGLERAKFLKKIEEKYDVPSAWYIPSSRYSINNDQIRDLSTHGEIGSHDSKHDGRLNRLKKQELVGRLKKSKEALANIVNSEVVGFRAPLLQHNKKILESLSEAGFLYDTSVPTWEPKHPSTMKSHGIGTVFPIKLNGLLEIPLTLTQDHQLLYVLTLNPREVLRAWNTMANVIRDIGGISMYLVHPDYRFADQNAAFYEELINSNVNSSFILPSNLLTLKI